MKVYKEKQFLIFDFEDGTCCKYDFARKEAIGKSGRVVADLRSQLKGLSLSEISRECVDQNYGRFLNWVQNQGGPRGGYITNIGSVLARVPHYAKMEQLFSAGVKYVSERYYYSINDTPKGLIKLCREYGMTLSNGVKAMYEKHPDVFQIAFELEYESIAPIQMCGLLSSGLEQQFRGHTTPALWRLIEHHDYNPKTLFLYLDTLKTYEGLEHITDTVREIRDYADMMHRLSPKFDKYPRHFLTTHRIAARNYNRLTVKFEEERFKKRINPSMERVIGRYRFIYPKTTYDIKDEAVQQHNCVASYIQRVIDGHCDILFMRLKDRPEDSLVTIEVRNNKIVQALQKYNQSLSSSQQEAVDQWNVWYAKKIHEQNGDVA